MATTTNFGWETPDDTDLVKDGALAMRTLGNAIDASMVDLKGGTTGQVLSKTSNTDMDFTWVTSDDANAIQNAIVDAKGDLITATAADTPARLAVGSNGDTLVADSAATTGLRWQGNYAAGKNVVINGDFGIWQRGTSFTVANDTYTADRFLVAANGGQTMAFTQQTFTPGTAPVAGYEGKFFYRYAVTGAGSGNTYNQLKTRIEGARTFAGQTATVSFWAKGSASYNITTVGYQVFGTGGSPSSSVLAWSSGNLAVTTSWQRFSFTFTMPSVSGKTFGTNGNDYIELYIQMPTNQTSTTDVWGVQLEAGSVATAFQTATGTIQGELAACQRYYQLVASGASKIICTGFAGNGTNFRGVIHMKVTMRTAPTLSATSGTNYYNCYGNNLEDAFDTVNFIELASDNAVTVGINSGISLTQGYGYFINTVNASASVALSAEL
jgi:hypothetical protein